MSKYDGRMFLERLVELRAAYKTTDHAATTMSVQQAIAHALDLLDHPDRLDAILADGSPDTASQLHPA
jgi:IS5 family transposase